MGVLSKTTITEAIACATVAQGVGASYNMAEFSSQRIVNFEVGSGNGDGGRAFVSLVDVAECKDGVLVHANKYNRLDLPDSMQHFSAYGRENSERRVARGYEMEPATNLLMILDVLGDDHDIDHPIFHSATLASVVFDVDAGFCAVWTGRPRGRIDAPQLVFQFAQAGDSRG